MIGLGQSASPVSAGGLTQLTLSMLAIVGLIFAIGWALKRFKIASPRSRGEIAVVDELALGPRERIILIRVGDSQVLVGVGAGGVVALTPLATPIEVKPRTSPPEFADRLREFMRRPGGPA